MKRTGVVSEVYPKMAGVILDGEPKQKLLCTYRRSQVIDRESEWRERSPVAPGDKVEVRVLGSKDGVIEEIYKRENCIQRRAPGREGKILHTLAANVDYLVIVASLHDPEFSPGLVDRFLIAAMEAEIAPALVINKIDLQKSADDTPWELYQKLGVRCYPLSTHQKKGIEPLRELVRGKTSVFCGHSGTGKTSLLQTLFGTDVGKIGAVSSSTGKGKHTTTVSTLIEAEGNTRFIDTPGIKEFGLHKIDPKELILYFHELHAAQERGEALDSFTRYESYQRIKTALETEGR